jgi:hypothetical protein
MTWHESRLAAQLLAEETVGRTERQSQHVEDAQMAKSIQALQRAQKG